MYLYELIEVPYNSLDRTVEVLTFYAESDETAIITATIHPFRLTVLELNRIISEEKETNFNPMLVGENRIRLLDKEELFKNPSKYPDLSGTEKVLKNTEVRCALESYMNLNPKERICYELLLKEIPDNLKWQYNGLIKLITQKNNDYLKFYTDNVERRRMYAGYLYSGWVGISS